MPARANRALRTAAVAGACVAALVVLAAAVALLPPVQLGVARAVADRVDGVELRLGHLWVTPWTVHVENLELGVAAAGLKLGIAEGDVDIALWSSLLGLVVDVEDATLVGFDVDLDLASGPPAEPAAERAAFTGLAAVLRLPPGIRLRNLDASGNLLIRPTTGVDVAGPWQLSAGPLAPAETAALELTASLSATCAGETLLSANIGVDASGEVGAASAIDELTVDARIDPLDDAPGLRVLASLGIDAGTERYSLTVDDDDGTELANLDAALVAGGRLEGTWEASVSPGVVAAFARGRSVADLSGRSTGQLDVDLAGGSVEIRSSTALEGRGWEAFDPELAKLGTIGLRMELDAAAEPGVVTASNVDISISSAQRGELIGIETLQPLRYTTGDWLVDPQVWGEPALRVTASSMPLEWLGALSGAANIVGGELSGAFELVRRQERQTDIVVDEPLRATGVRFAPVRGFTLPDLDLTLVPRATLSAGTLDAAIEELRITAATGFDVSLRGRASTSRAQWPLIGFEGRAEARVPALERLLPQLGGVYATTRVQLDVSELVLTVATAEIGANASDGRQLLTADLTGQQPLRLELPGFSADWDDFDAQSVALRLDRVPIDWVGAYVPELEFRGGEISGLLEATATAGQGLTLQTSEPLTIANLLPVYRGRQARDAWAATLRPTIHLGTAASSVAVDDLELISSSGNAIRADATLDAPAAGDRIAMSVSLDTELTELAGRYGLMIGGLHWWQSGELELSTRRLRLDELSIDIEDSAGVDIISIVGSRPFFVAAEPFGVSVDGESPEIFRATMTPLRLESLLPNLLGFDLEGELPEGQFIGRVGPGGSLVVAADDTLVFRDVTVGWNGAKLLDRVTTGVRYEVAYSAGGFEARTVDLTATDGNGDTLVHTTTEAVAPLTVERLLTRASVTVEAHLGPLAHQPVLADLPRFDSGLLDASLTVTDADAESTLAVTASLRDAATEAAGALPDVTLALDAAGVRGDHVTVSMPITLQSAQFGASDLRLDGTAAVDDAGRYALDANVTGQRLVAADLDRLAALGVPAGGPADAPARGRLAPLSDETLSAIAKLRAVRDSVPVWTDRLLARTTLDLGRVSFPAFDVDDVRGRLEITEGRAALTELRASLLGAELDAAATVDFDDAEARPYSLDFRADVHDIELGKLFLAVAPTEAPTAEGRFELTSTLTGTGLNPLDLGLSTFGELKLSGRDGIFRGLAAHAGTGSTAARAIGILTFSRQLRAVGRLLDGLGEIRFEQADFELRRTVPERIDVDRLRIVSPQLEIDAAGSLALAPLRPLLESPLDVSAQLAAAGDVAILFDGMGLLDEETGEAGYRAMSRRIRVGGTPIAPDTSDFWELMEQAGENARGSFGAGLRALNRRLEAAAVD